MRYLGMAQRTGQRVTDSDHLRQSMRDILMTPVGSRLARRDYGSLLSALIDQPQNNATRLQVMSAIYTALNRWEPRVRLSAVQLHTGFDGSLVVELTGELSDGQPLSLSVPVGSPT
ncbi:GPW/gp25 family protein [Lonsdalea quercina]|uniref:GPW/gp25 family protein n=1 Tax=Lonsdalea quercina TaxID=71657 RepID=UPI003976E5CE